MPNQRRRIRESVIDPARQQWRELGVDGAASEEEGEVWCVEVRVVGGGEVVKVVVDVEAEFRG